MVQFEAVGF